MSTPTFDTLGYAALTTAKARRAYFDENGYIVRRRLIDPALCEQAIACFRKEIKPYDGHLYRQRSANPERHEFDSAGNVVNSLLNPLSVDGEKFPEFRAVSERLLSQQSLFEAVSELYGETAVLVQSMYFEANPATWPHQDCYYLDDDSPGRLLGVWIALEDIADEAGRFYVVVGSHRHEVLDNAGSFNIATHHESYKKTVAEIVESGPLKARAPALSRGDVLLWKSRTIHGARPPTDRSSTRHSYTAHFIPKSSRFIQYQCIEVPVEPEMVFGQPICRPKDQNIAGNRWVFTAEKYMPKLFPVIKKRIIFWKIRRLRSSAP